MAGGRIFLCPPHASTATLLFREGACRGGRCSKHLTDNVSSVGRQGGSPARNMGLQETRIESLPFVTAELNYLAPTPGKPRTYAYDPPPGEPKSTNLPEPHDVPIFDGRPIAKSFSLDREGFALVKHPTIVRNFYDENEIRRVYYPAAEAFLRATLGADRVVLFDHPVRRRVEGAADTRGAGPRQPATRVHVDQTEASGPNRVREHVSDEADALFKG